MAAEPLEPLNGRSILLPLDPALKTDELLRNLRMNALLAHQHSIGRGDELVRILKNTIAQMEKTHTRVQVMSTVLFFSGIALLAASAASVVVGGGANAWNVVIGGLGGLTAFAATFWTAPLDKMSDSISDLVKLEVAFLGYMRVIGELDSAFQMQYLDLLNGSDRFSMDQVTKETTEQMKTIMSHTMGLIDQYVVGQGHALSEVQKRLKALEAARPGG
jgi:hypothetical protein